jgi:CDP-diacylglycerol--glycerol-3-phosphate 3-phosphatidyltransferase
MLKQSPLAGLYYRLVEGILVPALIRRKVEPDHLSLAGLALSALAGGAFVFRPFWGGVLTLLVGLADTLDGALARATGRTGKSGAFLDSVLDRYTELLILLGIWYHFQRLLDENTLRTLVIALVLFGSLMVSYTRARAEGLGGQCGGGLFQRPERIVLIAFAGLFYPLAQQGAPEAGDWLMMGVLILLAIGTNLTALWRFLHVFKLLSECPGGGEQRRALEHTDDA